MPKPRTIEKSKDFKGSMKRLINALDKWKKIMIIALLLGFSSAIISLITPDKVSQLTDTITDSLSVDSEVMNELVTKINSNSTGSDLVIKGTTITYREQLEFITLISQIDKENTNDIIKMVDTLPESIKSIVIKKMDFDSVKHYSLIIGILFLISAFFGYIQSYMLTTVSNNFARNLRDKISKKINILPLKYFDSHETGDVLSRVTNDVDTISIQMNNSLATLISSITLFIGSIIMMFKTNYIMAITKLDEIKNDK